MEQRERFSEFLVGDGQEGAIIHGNRPREESCGVCTYDGDVPGIAA
jgi:hypothetical protein